MPDAGKGPSFRFPSFSQCVSSGWKRGNGKQLIKEQGTLPYRERPFCFGLLSGAPDGGLHAFPYGGGDISGGGFSSVGPIAQGKGYTLAGFEKAASVGHPLSDTVAGCRLRREEIKRAVPPVASGDTFPEESARGWGPLRAGVSGPFCPLPVAAKGHGWRSGQGCFFPPQGSLVQASKTRLSNQKSSACGSRQLPAGRPALRQRCSRYCSRFQPCSTGTCGRKTPWRMPRRSSRP